MHAYHMLAFMACVCVEGPFIDNVGLILQVDKDIQ